MTILRAGCKINLTLHVGQKRIDGYHEIDSIFYPLCLPADILTISSSSMAGLYIETNEKIDGENILFKIYRIFKENTGFSPALKLTLKKNIPIGAGLGGGSSDAAQFLAWLNSQTKYPLPKKELMAIASHAGSDIPFFLVNKIARVQGTGENISPLSWRHPRMGLIMVFPKIHINTAFAYEALDNARQYAKKFPGMEKCLTKHHCQNKKIFLTSNNDAEENIMNIKNFHNDLEEPVFSHFPQLHTLKEEFLFHGADYAAMSGSGSTIFGIFTDAAKMCKAFKKLRQKYDKIYAVAIK